MTREDKLYSMRMQDLANVADGLGIKINKKGSKAAAIEKILEAEKNSTSETEDLAGDGTPLAEVGKEIAKQAKQKAKDVTKKSTSASDKPERKRGALIEYNGKAQNICAWAKELGKSANTLYSRLYILGWDVEKALTK